MIVDPPTLEVLLGVCLGGWSLYLTSERGRIVEDIKEIKARANDAYTKAEVLAQFANQTFLTRTEHKDFDTKISTSVDNLSSRIDAVLQAFVKQQ